MLPGPDVLTTCGNPDALLKISEQYVVGVGSFCGAISQWSTLQSYTSNELQQLREFSQSFDRGGLRCGAVGFIPSLFFIISLSIVITVTMFY